MESRKVVFKETLPVLIGEGIGVGAMLGIYALLGYFSLPVLWGGLIGGAVAVLNFFSMALGVSMAADKAQNQEADNAKRMIKGSYTIRLLILAVVIVAFVKSGICDILAMVIPLLFVRPAITIAEFFRKDGV